MAVCLRIHMDHHRNEVELWELSDVIPADKELNLLLKELEAYEDQISKAPIGGYNSWEKDFDDLEEFMKQLKEVPSNIRNNVFSIHIAKNAIVIDHWTKLGYFCDDEKMQFLFNKITNRLANHFASTQIIYSAESAYKTELIACMIYEGNDIDDILNWINKENIRVSETISGIKRHTEGRYYETDACYIEKL